KIVRYFVVKGEISENPVPHKTVSNAVGDKIRIIPCRGPNLLYLFLALLPYAFHFLEIDIGGGVYRLQGIGPAVTGTRPVVGLAVAVIHVATQGYLVH